MRNIEWIHLILAALTVLLLIVIVVQIYTAQLTLNVTTQIGELQKRLEIVETAMRELHSDVVKK